MKTKTRKPQENYDFIILDGKRIEPNQRLTVSQLYRVTQLIQSGHWKRKIESITRVGNGSYIYNEVTADSLLKTLDEDVETPLVNVTLTASHFVYGFDALYLIDTPKTCEFCEVQRERGHNG